MTSTTTDIIGARYGGVALKAPCVAATTAAITLDGLQTIDGVVLEADDRVLVKDQDDARENGIYVASTGLWQRAVDFDGSRDVVKGTRVSVTGGASAALEYQVISDNEIVVGTDEIIFRVFAGDHGGISSPPGDPYVIDISEEGTIIAIDASVGARTVTLPGAAAAGNGAEFTVVKSDNSGNFVTVNSVGGELLGYPSITYNLHATPATAVSDNGGFVRLRIAAEHQNRVFMTGDEARVAGAVGFPALNADHVVTRPADATGLAYVAIDLPLAYAAGYSGGATVSWVQTSCRLRVVGGTVTLVSNGTHWVYKYVTSDVWTGPKDHLRWARNYGYAGPQLAGTGAPPPGVDSYFNAFTLRDFTRSMGLGEDGDPVDLQIKRFHKDYLSQEQATSVPANIGFGVIYGQGSDELGFCAGQSGAISFRTSEEITTAGRGAGVNVNSTPRGKAESLTRLSVRSTGHVWLGGDAERGTVLVDPSFVPAFGVLSAAANPADGDTVTLDTVVYTFESGALDASTATAVEVRLGADRAESIANLIKAVNATGTAGTHYGTGTTRHTTVYATANISNTHVMDALARTSGAAGNAIVIGETGADLSWAGGAVTLSGGEDANLSHLGVHGDPTGAKVTLRAGSIIGGINNVSMRLTAKGNLGRVISTVPLLVNTAPTSLTNAGNNTLTAAQLLGGIIVRDCNGAGRTDTLPTAALLVAAVTGVVAGDTVECLIVNGSDAAETITLLEGAGGSWDAAQTAASRVIPQNTSKRVRLRLTNVTAASEAYVVYA